MEVDPRIKQLWELHLAMEIEHLRLACELMRKLDRSDPEAILPKELPDPITFQSNREYVRRILESQIDLTGDQAFFVPMSSLPEDHRFHQYQAAVHGTGPVPSEEVIKLHRERAGNEYRVEPLGEHPIPSARQAAE
jgi:hypothetical protein